MDPKDKKYSYDRFDSKGMRAGQAALDLMKDLPNNLTVEDVLIGMKLGDGYRKTILDEFERTRGHYPNKYYILTITKQALHYVGIQNAYENSARSFVLPLSKKSVMEAHPNAMKNFYSVDAKHEDIQLLWSLPSYGESLSVLKNPEIYDPKLVENIIDCFKEIVIDTEKFENKAVSL